MFIALGVLAALTIRAPLPAPSALTPPDRIVLAIRDASPMRRQDVRSRALPATLAARASTFGWTADREIARTARADGATTCWWLLRPEQERGARTDVRQVCRELAAAADVVAAAPDLSLRLAVVPNDPMLADQWHLSVSSAAIRARNAWDVQQGDAGVAIAILDSGVDRGHPDLASKIWSNAGEIPGNLVDDDGNGYVDDTSGWDFGNGDADPDPEPLIEPSLGLDEGWHGTFCAGLAAAATNNATGIAGVAWGSKIMALKVNDSSGDIPLSAVAEGVAYAIEQHAAVISMSFGTEDDLAQPVFQALVNDAIAGDVMCIAAAGNNGTDIPFYPAACESVLAVAATTSANHRAEFSNWGWYVDIAAPGAEVWSSIARNYTYDKFSALIFEILWLWDGVNPYMLNDGTSFSCPITAGVAALVRSQYPGMTAVEAMRHLVLRGDAVSYDNPIGPRLNAFRAVTEPSVGAPIRDGRERAVAIHAEPNPFAEGTTLRFTLPQGGEARVEVFDATGRRVRTWPNRPLGAGGHAMHWDGRNDAGVPITPGLYFVAVTSRGARTVTRLAHVE